MLAWASSMLPDSSCSCSAAAACNSANRLYSVWTVALSAPAVCACRISAPSLSSSSFDLVTKALITMSRISSRSGSENPSHAARVLAEARRLAPGQEGTWIGWLAEIGQHHQSVLPLIPRLTRPPDDSGNADDTAPPGDGPGGST